ncbi:hypothetical protein BDZ45DRAFT_684894 [Acephala macrosclerotiorum]|nr:hypothetical protein BDZ45DRAFT_684894 [Acephala macrosclerotiorum]
MARTDTDRENLKRAARQWIGGRQDLVLASDEAAGADTSISYVTGGTGPGSVCKVVIDKNSGRGHVDIATYPAIMTGPKESGYSYEDIPPGQDCIVYGSCAVLYIYYSST